MTNPHNDHNISLAAVTAVALFAAVADVRVQPTAAECSLRGADTLFISGATGKKYQDVDALNGMSTIIPSNVTRIDNNGFSLCESLQEVHRLPGRARPGPPQAT